MCAGAVCPAIICRKDGRLLEKVMICKSRPKQIIRTTLSGKRGDQDQVSDLENVSAAQFDLQ